MGLFNWFKSKQDEQESAKESQDLSSAGQATYPPEVGGGTRVLKRVSPNAIKTLDLKDSRSLSNGAPGGGRSVAFVAPVLTTAVANAAPPSLTQDKDIYIEIGDIVDKVPPSFLGDVSPHVKRRVSFRLSEIFADLSKGRATIPLGVLYSFCPEIFAQPVDPGDSTPVALPLQKLVEQVGSFEQRPDQILPENLAQIDTPISRVAAEDSGAALPNPAPPVGGSSHPPGLHSQAVVSAPPPAAKPPSPPIIPAPSISRPPSISMPQPAPAQMSPAASAAPPLPSATPVPASPPPSPPQIQAPSPPIRFDQTPNIANISAPPALSLPPVKRPPATVRATFSGGKITLRASPPANKERLSESQIIPPAAPPQGPQPPLNPSQRAVLPNGSLPAAPLRNLPPARPSQVPSPALPSQPPTLATVTQRQTKKSTARIPVPIISLQPSQANASPSSYSQGNAPTQLAPEAPVSLGLAKSAPPPVLPKVGGPTAAPASPSPASQRPAPIKLTQKLTQPTPSATTALSTQGGRQPTVPPKVEPEGAAIPFSGAVSSFGVSNVPKAESGTVRIQAERVIRGLPHDLMPSRDIQVADSFIEIPLQEAEPQLMRGSVKLALDRFLAFLPSDAAEAFSHLAPDTLIPLPLADVFMALPPGAISGRRDQVEEIPTEKFETPFSVKAEEDASRFGTRDSVQPSSPAVEQQAAGLAFPPPPPAPVKSPPTLAFKASMDEESAATKVESSAPTASGPSIPKPLPVGIKLAPQTVPSELPPKKGNQAEASATQPISKPLASHEQPKMLTVPVAAPTPPVAKAPPVNTRRPVEPASKPAEPDPYQKPSTAPAAKPSAQPDEGAPPTRKSTVPLMQKKASKPLFQGSGEGLDRSDEVPSAENADQAELQALFMTEEYLDAKGIVKHISRLPGISACLLMFADGLPIAGNLPDDFDDEAFSALVPRFFAKVDQATSDLRLGNVESLTLHTTLAPVTFLVNGGVGMALIHNRSRFLPGVREKLVAIVRAVNRIYSPESVSKP